MKVRDCHTDLAKQRTAMARMHAIRLELQTAAPDRAAELEAEWQSLDGSWIEERWLEIDGTLTEQEAIAKEHAELAAAEAKRAEHQKLKDAVTALKGHRDPAIAALAAMLDANQI